jgi:hypothetical protein
MDSEISNIELNENGLKILTQEILKGLIEDLKESQDNIDTYKTKMGQGVGFDMYGSLFNDSLKIKGSVRDKLIKMAGMIKDKAATSTSSGAIPSNVDIAALAEQILKFDSLK